jgi:hypothetical protein
LESRDLPGEDAHLSILKLGWLRFLDATVGTVVIPSTSSNFVELARLLESRVVLDVGAPTCAGRGIPEMA